MNGTTILNMIINTEQTITVFLVNGYRLKGKVISYDYDSILLESEGINKLIYKHAISTIEF